MTMHGDVATERDPVQDPLTDIETPPERSLFYQAGFRRWFVADSAQQVATSLSGIALPLLAVASTGSPLMAGVVVAAAAVGGSLALLPGGLLADHADRRRVVAVLACVGAALYLLIAALSLVPKPALWMLIPAVFGCGLVQALAAPSFSATLKALVNARRFASAASLAEGRSASIALAAPALGGIMFGLGAFSPFAAAALMLALAAVFFARIERSVTRVHPETTGKGLGPWEGIRFIARNGTLRALLVTATLANLGSSTILIASIFHLKALGVSAATIGLLNTLIAVGSLIGAISCAFVVPRMRGGRVVVISLAWMVLALAPLALMSERPVIVMALLGCAVISGPSLNAVFGGYLVARVPRQLQGRVDSAVGFIATLTAPLAPLIAGVGLQTAGYRGALIVCIIVLIVATLPSLLSSGVRRLPRPDAWEDLQRT